MKSVCQYTNCNNHIYETLSYELDLGSPRQGGIWFHKLILFIPTLQLKTKKQTNLKQHICAHFNPTLKIVLFNAITNNGNKEL